eukprot:gene5687-5925_t
MNTIQDKGMRALCEERLRKVTFIRSEITGQRFNIVYHVNNRLKRKAAANLYSVQDVLRHMQILYASTEARQQQAQHKAGQETTSLPDQQELLHSSGDAGGLSSDSLSDSGVPDKVPKTAARASRAGAAGADVADHGLAAGAFEFLNSRATQHAAASKRRLQAIRKLQKSRLESRTTPDPPAMGATAAGECQLGRNTMLVAAAEAAPAAARSSQLLDWRARQRSAPMQGCSTTPVPVAEAAAAAARRLQVSIRYRFALIWLAHTGAEAAAPQLGRERRRRPHISAAPASAPPSLEGDAQVAVVAAVAEVAGVQSAAAEEARADGAAPATTVTAEPAAAPAYESNSTKKRRQSESE